MFYLEVIDEKELSVPSAMLERDIYGRTAESVIGDGPSCPE
jgi:hypothetical protein